MTQGLSIVQALAFTRGSRRTYDVRWTNALRIHWPRIRGATGLVARTYMGYSRCRMCGEENGDIELSDGVFVWPSGLAHYVAGHGVRRPRRFVRHALATIDALEAAPRDEQ